jgi:hypothetical protein
MISRQFASRGLILSLLATFPAMPVLAQASPPAAAVTDPVATVRIFYDPKLVGWERRPHSKKLLGLYNAALRKSKQLNEPVSGLDFDPATGAQDADEGFQKTLRFTSEPRGADKALVKASMTLFKGQPETVIHFDLVLDGKAWKVDDISNPDPKEGWRWSTMLVEGAKGK